MNNLINKLRTGAGISTISGVALLLASLVSIIILDMDSPIVYMMFIGGFNLAMVSIPMMLKTESEQENVVYLKQSTNI